MGPETIGVLVAKEAVSALGSHASSNFGDHASKTNIAARIRDALRRLKIFPDATENLPMSYDSLHERRMYYYIAYIEGIELLKKHGPRVLEAGDQEIIRRQLKGSSFFKKAGRFVELFIASVFGSNDRHLSPPVAVKMEGFADAADKLLDAVMKHNSQPRRDAFRCPLVTQLFDGKPVIYRSDPVRSRHVDFVALPVILPGGCLVAQLRYVYRDTVRVDESFQVDTILRLSESTDIVDTVIKCLRSAASLHNLPLRDSVEGNINLLPYSIQGISDSDGPRFPSVLKTELSERPSNEAADRTGNAMADRTPPLELTINFVPHRECTVVKKTTIARRMGSSELESYDGEASSIQGTVDEVQSEAFDCIIHQPEVTRCELFWFCKHGVSNLIAKKHVYSGSVRLALL